MSGDAVDGKQQRQQLVTDFGTRLAVVKGYVQLLNRHIDRDDIPREQLVRYCRVLDAHIVLLEESAKRLVGDSDSDRLLEESAISPHLRADDKDSSSTST